MTATAALSPTRPATVPGYHFTLTCPNCDGPIVHVACGTSSGREARAVAVCVDCRVQLLVVASVSIHAGRHALPLEVSPRAADDATGTGGAL